MWHLIIDILQPTPDTLHWSDGSASHRMQAVMRIERDFDTQAQCEAAWRYWFYVDPVAHTPVVQSLPEIAARHDLAVDTLIAAPFRCERTERIVKSIRFRRR